MKTPDITEAEWEVMTVLWQRSPLTANQIIAELQHHTGWAPTTVRTLLDRLARKKIVRAARRDSAITFQPLATKDECVSHESENFLRRVFNGATQPLLLHFTKKARLTPAEIKELQRILKEKGQ
ncbi:MAG: BlaI/MecI/CopY family transcriptional regulator [Verrucomicrobiales bacterium]|jgi:BlaI family penicillinase repressor|nr:BlaI/MecI/CopY family transcriptional regulator [Verrucomicrobiales bacterium]